MYGMNKLAKLLALNALALIAAGTARSADFPPGLSVSAAGVPVTAFAAGSDGCDGHDVPDAPLRALRDTSGRSVAFRLHFVNRRLIGPSIDRLKID
jgi:hypothetical protein